MKTPLVPLDQLRGAAMPRLVTAFRAATVGKRIVDAGYVCINSEAWPILILEDGTEIIASCDDEGNGPGVLEGPGAAILCQVQLQ